MRDSNNRFSDDRAKEVIRRAIEIDMMERESVSEHDIRHIAAEIDIRPDSIDRALREAESESDAGDDLASGMRIHPESMDRALRERGLELDSHRSGTAPAFGKFRKYAYLVAFLGLSASVVQAVKPLSPYAILVAVPCILIIAGLYVLLPRSSVADIDAMRITDGGVHYRQYGHKKVRTLKWEEVKRVERIGRDVVELVGGPDMVIFNLTDFGDPESVFQIIQHKTKLIK